MECFPTRKLAAAVAVAILTTCTVATANSGVQVYPGRTHTRQVQVFAGVPVRVSVTANGDCDADLDLFIYDRFGRLLASNEDNEFRIASWTPLYTGIVTIRVVGCVGSDIQIIVAGGHVLQERWRRRSA